ENATVPIEQLPPMDYVPLSEKGEPGGVAELDSSRGLLKAQVPYVSGSWTGNGSITRTLTTGFRPSAVFIYPVDIERGASGLSKGFFESGGQFSRLFGGLFFGGEAVICNVGTTETAIVRNAVTLVTDGFRVKEETVTDGR